MGFFITDWTLITCQYSPRIKGRLRIIYALRRVTIKSCQPWDLPNILCAMLKYITKVDGRLRLAIISELSVDLRVIVLPLDTICN